MARLLLFLFSLLYFSCLAISQQAGQYHTEQFTTENGLPSNGIKGMQWDEQTGFLWLATEAGMTRFNGVDFIVFNNSNTKGFAQERMSFLIKNKAGEIFGSDIGSNYFRVKASNMEARSLPGTKSLMAARILFNVSGRKLQDKIADFLSQQPSLLWANVYQLSDSSAILITTKKEPYYISLHTIGRLLNNFSFQSNAMLLGERFCILNKNNELLAFNEGTGEMEAVTLTVKEGNKWAVGQDNPVVYSDNGMANPILLSGNNAWLLKYNNGNHTVEAELVCTVIPRESYIQFVQYSAKNRTLFIGTDSKGIIVINENKITPVKKSTTDIRERNAYYAQVELPGSMVLTNEAHVIGNGNFNSDLPITGKFNYTVFKSGDSLLWYSQVNEKLKKTLLHQYNYNTHKLKIFEKMPQLIDNYAMISIKGENYIAASYGVGKITGDSVNIIFPPDNRRNQLAGPYAMLEFSPGIVGVASCDGLILYNLNNGQRKNILSFPGNCVRNLWKYGEYIFIGTYGQGYYVWKNGLLKKMPLDKNGFLLYTHCFVPDSSGFCWISTNRGLFKAKINDLTEAFDKNIPQVYYHYFGKKDGMSITEMNGGCAPCALVMKNGTLSFPTMDGLLWVNPEKAIPLLPEGNIYVDEFIAGNKIQDIDSLQDHPLSYVNNNILVKLGFSSWCNKENIYLDYKLNDGKEWIPVDISKSAVIALTNLAPGTYTLLVRKLNGFGINNYSYREIKFTISTPWHRQWWFYVLCVLAVFGIIAVYLKWRTKRYKINEKKLEQQVAAKTKELLAQNAILEKNNSIKTRLISIISHDIVTPLKFVTVAGKNLIEKRTMMSEDLQQDTIREITNTSQELQLLSTNILNWIKYQDENRRMAKEYFNVHELVNQVLGILQALAKQKGLTIVNKVPPGLMVVQLYEPLKILIYNLLTNAIHFTEKGEITVSAVSNEKNIILSVKDEGIGMTAQQIQRLMAEEVVITSANVDNKKGHGLGYLIIKDLIKTMEASFSIKSEKGEGVVVSIWMPVTK